MDGRNRIRTTKGNHGKLLFVGVYRGIITPGFIVFFVFFRLCERISSIHSRELDNSLQLSYFQDVRAKSHVFDQDSGEPG